MSCGDGFCEPTATKAVLNVLDLENDIAAAGNMTVQSYGRNVDAKNIVVEAKFSSPGSTALNLFADGAIRIDAAVTIGSGGQEAELQLECGIPGTLGLLSFGPIGSISFDNTSDGFGINGVGFTLVNSLSALSNAIASNPQGFYALANSYDARKDGTYQASPIETTFTGYFEALGNAISHVTLDDEGDQNVGLFAATSNSDGFGVIRNFRLESVSIRADGVDSVGGIAGLVGGTVSQSSVSGTVTDTHTSEISGGLAGSVFGSVVSSWSSAKVQGGSDNNATGGLVGENYGAISNSYATGVVTGGGFIGGLVGANEDNAPTVSGSFATGAVEISAGTGAYAGGLAGTNFGVVTNSYATGPVTDMRDGDSELGGLIGFSLGDTSDSYATGALSGPGSDELGGVVGYDESGGGFSDAYWDVSTSGVSQGAGNIANDPGITGLTSKQLRSRLPHGFDKSVWKEKAGISRGFPWLIQNPAPK
jgi:hypothetical protein